jgi:hypothetical protein
VTINKDDVMPGVVPGIHVYDACEKDGRVRPGHDENFSSSLDCRPVPYWHGAAKICSSYPLTGYLPF